jgi:RNA polymerase sigma-70 factor (ECF subfamily)
MAQPESHDVTQLLIQVTEGDRSAVDELLPRIYSELRRLAGGYFRRERVNHTLDPTALVHEAYLRLVDQTRVEWRNRAHFLGVAANLMRRILVDHARSHHAHKRGGEFGRVALEDAVVASPEKSQDVVAIDSALDALAKIDPVKSRIVELRYFGGLSIEETAAVMETSVATVNRQWRMAKAWLYGELTGARE